jgi:2-methylisocitrate lyase-like PEP mutase family enzyme
MFSEGSRRAVAVSLGTLIVFIVKAMTPAQKLREVPVGPALEVMPGCFDALSAKLVADAGFKVTFMSGFAVSAARLGLPDTGLISFAEMLDSLRNCASGAARIPLIGDGDTGYGNALNVQRTVVEYARAGAAAVMIEDQVSPKKCGHTRGKQVIGREEARMKIRAAVDARRDADILILARTDARAVHGFDEALDRCRDFETEGADIIFLEAPENELEMRRFCQAMRKPCMANMVPGGKTPILPPQELQSIGYKLALYPVVLMSSAIAAMQAALAALRPESKKAFPPSVSFAELQQVVGFPDYWERETRYKASD